MMRLAVLAVCLCVIVMAPARAADRYWVSLGSYGDVQNAETARVSAQARIFAPLTILIGEVDGRVYQRLVIGPYTDASVAHAELEQARRAGYADAWVLSDRPTSISLDAFDPMDDELESFDDVRGPRPVQPAVAPDALQVVDTAPDEYMFNRMRRREDDVHRAAGRARFWSSTDVDVRMKLFSTASLLPGHDVQRQAQGTPAYDHSADLRIMLKQDVGPVRLILDHSTVALNGDGIELNLGRDTAVDQTVTNDRARRWNWTWEVDDGKRHQSFHRLDRLALKWQSSHWGVTVGREAVSWGNGIVFQPMDLFSPFSPTVVDRDYKSGDDLVLVDRLLGNGQDLQLLYVARRGMDGEVDDEAASAALKWHGYAGPMEFDVLGARHYDRDVFAGAVRFPVGQALVRVDVVASEDVAGDRVVSGIVNGDFSFMLAQRNAYVFVEYFHNGWGVSDLPDDVRLLPVDLQERLARGEVFNVMKNYLAAGMTYEWHPLITQSATIITNLHDQSSLFQSGFSYAPGDNQTLQLGWIEPLGAPGDEYGGLPLAGRALTTGAASRIYFRWVYYL